MYYAKLINVSGESKMSPIQASKKRCLESTDVVKVDSKRTKSVEKSKFTETIFNNCKTIII